MIEAWPSHGSSHAPSTNDNLSVKKLRPDERLNFEMAIFHSPELAKSGAQFQFGIRALREPWNAHVRVTEFLSQWLPVEVPGPRWVEVWTEVVTLPR